VSPAVLALLALVVALALSMTSRINVGLVAIALAWGVGVYAAGLKVETVIAGFPATLFLTLAGVTLLFAVAQANGTLDLLAAGGAHLVRGNAALLPLLFWVLACVLSTIGPGAIASVALVAPVAMATGARAGVPNFLMAVMVGTGANSGNLSPVSAVGAMVNSLMVKGGIPASDMKVWGANFFSHLIVAAGAYLLFGGLRLLRSGAAARTATTAVSLDRHHWITIAVTMAWMLVAIVFRVNIGLSAFCAATVLILLRVAPEQDVIRKIPMDIIFMVTGVTMLIGVLEATGGLELFTGLIARIATPGSVNGVIAFVTGILSTYSSTSGVVLPAFLPMVPGLVRQIGGGDPLAVALSINVGASLVDVSPLSTLGALCLAAVVDRSTARGLFRQLLIWGLSMAVVGALLCWLFANAFARA
jgi:di/tricarboxylate transporter